MKHQMKSVVGNMRPPGKMRSEYETPLLLRSTSPERVGKLGLIIILSR